MPSMKNVTIVDAIEMGTIKNLSYYPPKAVGAAKIIAPKQRYAVRFPPMLTWGASDYEKEGVRDGKFKLAMQYSNEPTENSDLIYENHKQFQENLIDDIVKNSKAWFGKEMSREIIKSFAFKSIFVYPKTNGTADESRAPSYYVKIPKKNDKFDVEMYDEHESLIYPSNDEDFDLPSRIIKGTHVPVMWIYSGFVIVNGLVYSSCVLSQIAVSEPTPSLAGQCLLNQKKPTISSNDNAVAATVVYDSDDDVKTYVKSEPVKLVLNEPVIEDVQEQVTVHPEEPVIEHVQEHVTVYPQESDDQSVVDVSKKKRFKKGGVH